MYNIDDKFLYEILEDYQDTDSKEKQEEIFCAFMEGIWASANRRRTYKKDFSFSIPSKLLATDIGKIFYTYSSITFQSYKSKCSDKDHISLIRQKLNNIYTIFCDEKVCIAREYMDAVKYPKQLYHRWLKDPGSYDTAELTNTLDEHMSRIPSIKSKYSNRKLQLAWKDYQILIEKYIKRCFINYRPVTKMQSNNDFLLDIDFMTEDNYCVRYICKCLDGYMRNYQKEYFSIHRGRNMRYTFCSCGNLYDKKSNRQSLCPACQQIVTRNKTKLRVQKHRESCCNVLEDNQEPL